MKTLTAGMLTAIAQEVTTLVNCWQVTRVDATQFFFTDHVADLVIDGDTYSAATGMSASAVATSSDLAVDNLEASGALSSSAITDADIIAGKWDFAAIVIFQVDYTNLANGKIIQRTGTIGQLSSGRSSYKAELRGMFQPFAQMFGRNVNPACDTDLGSSVCTIDLTPFTFTGNVGLVAGTRFSFVSPDLIGFAPSGGTLAYFVGGTVLFTSGANAGLKREIKTYDTVTGAIEVWEAFSSIIGPTDGFTAVAGCDKNATTCQAKFSNIINFQGFPQLPGLDSLAQGPQ